MPSIPRCNKDRIRDGLCPSDESRSWRHPNPGINLGWACLWVRAPRAEGGKVGGFSIEMQISIDPMKRHATRQLQAGRRSKTRMAHDACLLPPASEEEKRKSRRENTKGAERSCCTAGSCSATQANQRRLFRIRLFRRDKIACGPCWPFGGAGAAVGPLLPCCCCCHPPCCPAALLLALPSNGQRCSLAWRKWGGDHEDQEEQRDRSLPALARPGDSAGRAAPFSTATQSLLPPPTPKREPSLSARPHTTQQPSNQSTAPGSWPNSPGLYDDAALSCHSLIQISIPLSLFPHLHSVIFSILWCCLFCCPRLSTHPPFAPSSSTSL